MFKIHWFYRLGPKKCLKNIDFIDNVKITVKKNDIVFSIGPAGTGKTFLAVAFALAALDCHDIDRIILCRPAVEAGESLGFLPGDLKDKVDPYLAPLYDSLRDLYSKSKLNLFIFSNNHSTFPSCNIFICIK